VGNCTVVDDVGYESMEEYLRLSGRIHDLHREFASRVFGVPYDEVTPHQRMSAKRLSPSFTLGRRMGKTECTTAYYKALFEPDPIKNTPVPSPLLRAALCCFDG